MEQAYEEAGRLAVENTAKPTELSYLIDRLREEHDALRLLLGELEQGAGEVAGEGDQARGNVELLRLRRQAAAFMEVLEEHAKWEETVLFPLLGNYYQRALTPTITPSLWMMEKDHELAVVYVKSFLDALSRMEEGEACGVCEFAERAGRLQVACRLLFDHLDMEETLVFPLVEEMLTDLELLFS